MRNFHKHTLHPWHGIDIHPETPEKVMAFIEIVPTDTVKFEIDKESGFLRIDRPQKYSNAVPSLYGFIPQTYCGEKVAELAGFKGIKGDGDPLDICVLTERRVSHGNILAEAIPIGGLRMIDKNEVDDKIIAVLKQDAVFGNVSDITELPQNLVDRLVHYFLTYKNLPGSEEKNPVTVEEVYGAEKARKVINASIADYRLLTGRSNQEA